MHSSSFLTDLPPAVVREIRYTLETTLPLLETDTVAARASRLEAAMAMLAAYLPADVGEAQLAAQIVVADAHAKDCFRLAIRPSQDPDITGRCRAQAATMIRLMQSGLRALQRTQALRQKAEAVMQPAAMERAGYWFRDVASEPT